MALLDKQLTLRDLIATEGSHYLDLALKGLLARAAKSLAEESNNSCIKK